MAVSRLNANAELMGRNAALFMNINAAKGLQDVMKTNLGPKGTVKMLVGGAGDLKLTKVCFSSHLRQHGVLSTPLSRIYHVSHARGIARRTGTSSFARCRFRIRLQS